MELVRQTFVKRLVANIVDGVIVVVAFAIVGTLVGVITHSPYLVSLITSIMILAYTTLEVIKAQTIGKMVMKMKITNVDGTPATQQQLIKRWAIKNSGSIVGVVAAVTALHILTVLAALPMLAVVVGCFLVLKPERLAGHDLLAGTAVCGPEAMEFTAPTAAQLSPTVAK